MAYQNYDIHNDSVADATQTSDFSYKIDLLVRSKISKISKTTSDPKRAHEVITQYMGIQTEHQTRLGHIWYMRSMLKADLFPHEIHILARKTVYGYLWRNKETFDNKIRRQCRVIVETRIKMASEDLRKLSIYNKRTICMLHKVIDRLKLRVTLRTFSQDPKSSRFWTPHLQDRKSTQSTIIKQK